MDYKLLKLTIGVVATLGLYSILYRETKLYRFFEHLFLGLSVGWTIVVFWTEVLKEIWWNRMVGEVAQKGSHGAFGHWAYAFLLPLGCMGYFVFSKRHNWISRIPIGLMLGLGAGQQILVWWTAYGPQVKDSMRVILPTQFWPLFVPSLEGLTQEQIASEMQKIYVSQAINNIIFIVTLLVVVTYFLYSIDPERQAMKWSTKWGRWLMMVGFGAIFGSTVMARFALMIDRMYLIWIEWLIEGILKLR
jgi:hypothetical protein